MASTAPGTLAEAIPRSGIVWNPRPTKCSRVAPRGAAPLPLSAVTVPVRPSSHSRKVSPPSPLIMGWTTPSTPAAARAASMALPPERNTCSPAAEARG